MKQYIKPSVELLPANVETMLAASVPIVGQGEVGDVADTREWNGSDGNLSGHKAWHDEDEW